MTEVIEVQVPVDPSYLGVLRTAAAGLATRLRFSLGAIEDLRIAVDEAASMLIAGSADRSPAAEVTCRFAVTDADVTVSVSVPGSGSLPGSDSIPWRVMDALAGSVKADHSAGETVITLVKEREAEA